MTSDDVRLSADLEAEFNPHVVILANNPQQFAKHAALLQKNGFMCKVITSPENPLVENPRAGTVFYLSFNLKTADAVATTRMIETALGMTCIVFAESDDFQTAAKLSSAKFAQTLHFPHTEKNFLMGVRMIVKRRKAQHEKDQRRKEHQEKQKSKKESLALVNAGAIVVQQAKKKPLESMVKLFKGAARQSSTVVVQKGVSGADFSVRQEAPTYKTHRFDATETQREQLMIVKTEEAAEVEALAASEEFVNDEILAELEQEALPQEREEIVAPEPDLVLAAIPQPEPAPVVPAPKPQPRGPRTALQMLTDEWSLSTLWAVLTTSLIGILICLYCLFQILVM